MKFLWGGSVILFLAASFFFLDLKPQVSENFFFSSDDPQFLSDKIISQHFPQPSQIILGARGDIRSPAYIAKLKGFTGELASIPGVFSVLSLIQGPHDVEDALKSPLWKRVLIAKDGKASFVSVFVENVPMEELIPKIEAAKDRWSSPVFEVMISGGPYITELIRRDLARDLKVFTGVTIVVFALVLFAIFRSWRIILGTLAACLNASVATLILAQILKIEIGPLTANLSTIVFVLTLSHIVFMTFNWRRIMRGETGAFEDPVRETIRITSRPSFWSMFTVLLGFMSLLFAEATPLRQLGISGSIGALVAFAAAYLVYPPFLRIESQRIVKLGASRGKPLLPASLFRKPHGGAVIIVFFSAGFAALGLWMLDTDPNLFAYFRKGSPMREGLEYIDRNGGSVPLKILITDPQREKFDTQETYQRLWKLHEALERDPAVGTVVSLPVLLGEAKRQPLAKLLPMGWLLKIMEMPQFGRVADHFVTKDRTKTLFVLRMNEAGRDAFRVKIVDRIKKIVEAEGFNPERVGGIYFLQGELAQLIARSVLEGLVLLILIFVGLTWFLSRSFRVAAAIAASLGLIAVLMLGVVGHLRVPFDIISAPAVNITLGLSIDAMIHMLFFVRRTAPGEMNAWKHWADCGAHMWKPVLCSGVVLAAGFGVFALSTFPPTQRFGASVVFGMGVASAVALFVFPVLAAAGAKK